MRRRTLGITAVSAAALGAAAACGDDSGSEEDSQEFSGELVIWADETRTPVLKEFVKDFESTVGVKVDKANLTSTDYTLTAQLGSAPASGVYVRSSALGRTALASAMYSHATLPPSANNAAAHGACRHSRARRYSSLPSARTCSALSASRWSCHADATVRSSASSVSGDAGMTR